MKKESKSRFIAVKKYFATRNETIKNILCVLLACLLSFNLAISIFSFPSSNEMVACKEELASYLASPSRFAVNTDIYTLKISSEGTTLSINNSLASCKAVFDDTTNNYNFTSYRSIFATVLAWICITFVFGIVFFFAINLIFSAIADIHKWIFKHYKDFRREYMLNKAEADLQITRKEAEEYEVSIQQKEEFDRAYKKGYNTGYNDGRSKGFKRGQRDVYNEGYAKGYADGQNALSESINSFMNDNGETYDCK